MNKQHCTRNQQGRYRSAVAQPAAIYAEDEVKGKLVPAHIGGIDAKLHSGSSCCFIPFSSQSLPTTNPREPEVRLPGVSSSVALRIPTDGTILILYRGPHTSVDSAIQCSRSTYRDTGRRVPTLQHLSFYTKITQRRGCATYRWKRKNQVLFQFLLQDPPIMRDAPLTAVGDDANLTRAR